MQVLLIDADSVIPNIPLMKISQWHKKQGDQVVLHKCNLPYYPNRKKVSYHIPTGYDKVYCSVVFEGNMEFIQGGNIIFGGTGVDLITKLPPEIERCDLDYSIYPDNDVSYGFISRGCIRKCLFCKVPEKEGYIHRVSDIDSIVKHKKVKFLDNNILAYPDHKSILLELANKKIKCQFNQGLDIRLLDSENSKLLSKLNYLGEYVFAFDSLAIIKLIENKLLLLKWVKDWGLKFFIYVHPDMLIAETVKRLIFLKGHKCLPYVMRDIKCWDSVNNEFYIDVSAYTNQVHLFKKMEFGDFLIKRHTSKKRIEQSLRTWNENIL